MDFDQLFKDLKDGVLEISSSSLKDFREQFKEDADDFLNSSKTRLEKWTKLLKEGSLDKEDFEFLVKGQKDLFEMKLLKQAGLTRIKLDKLKSKVFEKVIQTVITNLPSLIL